VCKKDLCSTDVPFEWRPDITGNQSAGNVCFHCIQKYEADARSMRVDGKPIVRIKLTKLQGDVINHTILGNSKGVITSPVLSVKGACVVETLNTIYILDNFGESKS
jgi:hypothetical protein